jgi:glycosyltransferase involved in cell wall biosynthesis
MKIAIIITSYNQANYIKECLESALNNIKEIGNAHECIIYFCDDCSNDGTYEIGSSILSSHAQSLRFFTKRNETNTGICLNYKTAISTIESDYIAFLEGDDQWSSGHLQSLINAAKLHQHPTLLWTPPTLLFEEKKAVLPIEKYVKDVREKLAAYQDMPMSFTGLFIRFFPTNLIPSFSGVMCKTSALQSGISYAPPIARWLDYWLWCQIIPKSKGVCLSKSTYSWRITSSSLNSDSRINEINAIHLRQFRKGAWKYLHKGSFVKAALGYLKRRTELRQ